MSWTSESRRDELLQAWLDGEITPSGREELETLRAQDPDLDREARQLSDQTRLLRDAAVEDPPGDLTASIMQEVKQTAAPGRLYAFLFRPRTLTYRLVTGFTAAAALAALVFLVHGIMTRLDESRQDTPEDSSGVVATSPEPGDEQQPAGDPTPDQDDGTIVIQLAVGEASRVELVGDFNDWNEDGLDLEDEDGDGVWTLRLDVEDPGRYSYRIRVDGEKWVTDPGADAQVDDGFGGTDSVRYVL